MSSNGTFRDSPVELLEKYGCPHTRFGCDFLGDTNEEAIGHLKSCKYEPVKEALLSLHNQVKEKEQLAEELESLKKQLEEKDQRISQLLKELAERDKTTSDLPK